MKYIQRHSKAIELIVEVVFLVALFLLGLFLDYKFATSLFWKFYLFMAVLALILLLPVYVQYRRKQELWLFFGFNISLLALHFLALTPVKPFTKFYLDIKNGMTIQEVQGLFNQRFPKGGRFRQPEWTLRNEDANDAENHRLNRRQFLATPDQNLHYILDLTDGRYNAEMVTVYFKDGKVVGTNYSPD
ncbi:hypothetical protein [Calothrix sp. UHCC 0171]|uniref:hypothetical protein n=1 Tax=Calothrix sp. UHCC 0171 TaxID=3110245 RepID=UPI002B1F94AD|nr:hypothetical protein [Calothrix sp. UHCC 0171]MEA5569956.1 hypothetical protein [Calothrix sp. UHCC 0171]